MYSSELGGHYNGRDYNRYIEVQADRIWIRDGIYHSHTHLPIANMDMVPQGKSKSVYANIEYGYRSDMRERNMVIECLNRYNYIFQLVYRDANKSDMDMIWHLSYLYPFANHVDVVW